MLVLLLAERGHRVVPVASAEEAVDLAHRMDFNILFASVQLPGINWLTLFDKVRPLVDGFVLMTDTFDPPLADKLGHILHRPVTAAALDRVMAALERQFSEESEKRSARTVQP
jgi:CheY-like chemotaxis protein